MSVAKPLKTIEVAIEVHITDGGLALAVLTCPQVFTAPVRICQMSAAALELPGVRTLFNEFAINLAGAMVEATIGVKAEITERKFIHLIDAAPTKTQ